MKVKVALTLILSTIIGVLFVNSQNVFSGDIPEPTSSKLGNLFPGATNISWTMSNPNYKATFDYNNNRTYCTISSTGKWIFSETELGCEVLPHSTNKHLQTNFPSSKIQKCILQDSPSTSEYAVFIEDTINSTKLTVIYNKAGSYVRKLDAEGNDLDLIIKDEGKKQLINAKELPSVINSFIISSYPNHSIKSSYFLNDDTHKNTYYIILENPTTPNDVKLYFDFQGKIYEIDDPSIVVNEKRKENSEKNKTKEKKKENQKNEETVFPESKVPTLAIQTFKKKEPKAEEAVWDTLRDMYIVTYHNAQRDYDCRMYFTESGVWKSTHIFLDQRNLHPQILTYFEKNLGKLKIFSAESVSNADKTKYTLVRTYNPNWLNKPMVYNLLYFSTSGRLENEVLADYIDPKDEYKKKMKEEEGQAFYDYIDEDNAPISDDVIDGQVIPQKELPGNINKYINEKYKGYIFKEAIIMSDNNNFVYSIFLKKEGYNEKKRVIFDIKGNFVSEEVY